MDESKPEKEDGNGEKRRLDPELLKKGLRCDLDQYEMLKRCSDRKDMTEWNDWRKEHPTEDVLLEGADLSRHHLKGIKLQLIGGEFEGEWSGRKTRSDVYLKAADLRWADLGCAALMDAHLEGAKFQFAHLEKADIAHAHLQSAQFQRAIVDGETSLWKCYVDRKTNFEGVALGNARIDPATRQLLEYNIRRQNWEKWYEDENVPIEKGKGIFSNDKLRKVTNRLPRRLAREFWRISDYGISTKEIIKTFFMWALVFAAVYLAWGLIDYHLLGIKDNPGIVSNLFVLEGEQKIVSAWLVPFRSIYFSIVTMTTLGFGDMYANAHYFVRGLFGHILLALQVILGYVLLGALVTRFAVLFTAGGPAGRFANEHEEKDKT